MKKNTYYSVCTGNKKTDQDVIFEKNIKLGVLLCVAGAAVAVWAFYIGLLKLLGIAVFLAANALFLAGVYQLLGVAEIPCPVCGKKTGVARLQKECKCRSCGKKFRIKAEKR